MERKGSEREGLERERECACWRNVIVSEKSARVYGR